MTEKPGVKVPGLNDESYLTSPFFSHVYEERPGFRFASL